VTGGGPDQVTDSGCYPGQRLAYSGLQIPEALAAI